MAALSPRAETRLKEVEGLLEDICDCFWTETSRNGDELFVTESYNGDTIAVSVELEALISAAQKVLFDEPMELPDDFEV